MQRMAGKRRFAELEREAAPAAADVSEIAKPASEEREGGRDGGVVSVIGGAALGVTALSDTKTSSMRMMTAFTR